LSSHSAGSALDLTLFKDSFRTLISPDFDIDLFSENFKSSSNFLNSSHDSHIFKLCLFNTNDQAYAALIPKDSTIEDVIHLDRTDPVPSNDAALVRLGYTLSEQYSLNHVYAELFPSNTQSSFNPSKQTTEKKIPNDRLDDFNRLLSDKTPRIALFPKIEIASDVAFTQMETQTNVYSQQRSIVSPAQLIDCTPFCFSKPTTPLYPEPTPNTGQVYSV
jgi:hypothetical protein